MRAWHRGDSVIILSCIPIGWLLNLKHNIPTHRFHYIVNTSRYCCVSLLHSVTQAILNFFQSTKDFIKSTSPSTALRRPWFWWRVQLSCHRFRTSASSTSFRIELPRQVCWYRSRRPCHRRTRQISHISSFWYWTAHCPTTLLAFWSSWSGFFSTRLFGPFFIPSASS